MRRLKIYHADLRVAEGENLRIPFVLMERSQMAAVIVGPMQPPEVEAMLLALHAAVREPTWRCESLLFLLPPSARLDRQQDRQPRLAAAVAGRSASTSR